MSYPADARLSTVLAIDYDGLIIPAGERHIDTLKNEAHVNGYCGFPSRRYAGDVAR